MRKGTNPAKHENTKVESNCFHQIIVPVYLPKLEDYYAEGLEILKLCLESIYLTVHDKTYISVVNNGSCNEVKAYLDDLVGQQKIQEVIHTSAIGKINAIAKGLSGHNFDLVTITDADVLFTNGWQKAVYEIYETFPKAGMVGTTPNSKMLRHFTENIHFDYLFDKTLKFRSVSNPKDMIKFADSIDNKDLFKEIHLQKILSIEQNNIIANIGTGHFTGTYKINLLKKLREFYSYDKISTNSDKESLDIPSVENGHWRLSTQRNFTYHLGNHIENWMLEKFSDTEKNIPENFEDKPIFITNQTSHFNKLKQKITRKLLFNKYLWSKYLQYLGLNKNQAKIY